MTKTKQFVCTIAPIPVYQSKPLTLPTLKALIAPITNFTDLVTGAASSATIGAPIQLDLGGRGIRSIDRNANNQYLIVAGPADSATGTAPKDFRLYTWTGNAADAIQVRSANLTALNAGGSFEFRQINPVNNQDGGEPGGNIRVGFLFNPSRVTFVDRPGGTSTTATTVNTVSGAPALSASPGRIDPTNVDNIINGNSGIFIGTPRNDGYFGSNTWNCDRLFNWSECFANWSERFPTDLSRSKSC